MALLFTAQFLGLGERPTTRRSRDEQVGGSFNVPCESYLDLAPSSPVSKTQNQIDIAPTGRVSL